MVGHKRHLNELTLKEKIELLDRLDNGEKAYDLALIYKIGKSTITGIKSQKEELRKRYFEENDNANSKRKQRKTDNDDLNAQLYAWFIEQRALQIPISGPMLIEKAQNLAKTTQCSSTFKASSGWLTAWKFRYNINQRSIAGEAGDVDQEVVELFKERIPDLIGDYSPDDILNCDELACVWKELPSKTLAIKGSICTGGKQFKERFTALACVSMSGKKMPLYCIGKSAQPRCFQKTKHLALPLTWRANRKGWMTSALFTEFLNRLNGQMRREKRHIMLFLDNCSVHPAIELSNVKLQFLPPNTTACLQPLDAGIIRTLKARYRTKLLRTVLVNLKANTSLQLAKKGINLYDSLVMLCEAWTEVDPVTIRQCFYRCGFTGIGTPQGQDEGVLDEATQELHDTIETARTEFPEFQCNADDYIAFDELVPARETAQNDEQFVLRLELEEDEESEDNVEPVQEPEPIRIADALRMVKDLKRFSFEQQNSTLTELMSKLDNELHKHVLSKRAVGRQTNIEQFFNIQH